MEVYSQDWNPRRKRRGDVVQERYKAVVGNGESLKALRRGSVTGGATRMHDDAEVLSLVPHFPS